MTAVMLFGDVPSTGLLQARAVRLATQASVGAEEFDELTRSLSAGPAENGAVLLVYPAWCAGEARRLLATVRVSLGTDRVAGIPLSLPPLAISLVADQLAHMGPYLWPGALAGLAHHLARTMVTGAWVSSVARLEQIQTGIADHLASYLPNSGFMVLAAPPTGVHRITAREPLAPLEYRPEAPVLMVMADEGGDLDWLRSRLAPAVGAGSMVTVTPQPLGQTYWGTKKYLEYVALCAHPQALERAARAMRLRDCEWCGEPIAARLCPFCSMVQPELAQPVPPNGAPAPEGPPVQPVQPVRPVQQLSPHTYAGYATQPGLTRPVQVPAERPRSAP